MPQVEEAVLPKQYTRSATRARDPSIRPATGSGATGITVVQQKDSRWHKQWNNMQQKVANAMQNLIGQYVFNARINANLTNAAKHLKKDMPKVSAASSVGSHVIIS